MVIDTLTDARQAVESAPDPDGVAVHQALLVAYQVGMSAADLSDNHAEQWTFASLAVRECLDTVADDASDTLTVPAGTTDTSGIEAAELERHVRLLLAQVSTVLADATGREAGNPWRRLAWAKALGHLDDALRELP
ncbi:hypothetical protein [Micromonospora sp. SH-82]|uniref:hypothetical protein n=1 Tax=Micromonospora sp. SH-82 TaxID=3132938 RepID=UPI003EB73234